MKTPDVTPMQLIVGAITGVITAALAVVNVFGWYAVSGDQAAAALGLWTALGGVAVIADAVIRNGRSRVLAAKPAAAAKKK